MIIIQEYRDCEIHNKTFALCIFTLNSIYFEIILSLILAIYCKSKTFCCTPFLMKFEIVCWSASSYGKRTLAIMILSKKKQFIFQFWIWCFAQRYLIINSIQRVHSIVLQKPFLQQTIQTIHCCTCLVNFWWQIFEVCSVVFKKAILIYSCKMCIPVFSYCDWSRVKFNLP